jgi:N-acetylneuraminic acid mutarotase
VTRMRRYGVLAVLASGLLRAGAAGATESWTLKAPLPVGRESPAVVTAGDGTIYAIGGTTNSSPYTTTEVDRYTPRTDSWATVAPLPVARTESGAVLDDDGRIYVVGGYKIGVGYLNEVDRYTPATDHWRAVPASLPTARNSLAAASDASGRIYAIGGYNNSFDPNHPELNVVERYDPATNTWSTLPAMPTARYGLAATAGLDGWIYVIGGCSSTARKGALRTVEAYDPVRNTWHRRASMNTPRCVLSAATGSDGLIYAWGGGTSRGDDWTSAEAYDPATNTWAAAPSTNVAHLQGGGAASGGAIYAIAGQFPNAAVVESLALPGVLTLSATSGPPGTQVRVEGTGFVADETVSIAFDGSLLPTSATTTTSFRGWLSQSITVPAGAAVGPHTITATGATSGFTSQATFTVT